MNNKFTVFETNLYDYAAALELFNDVLHAYNSNCDIDNIAIRPVLTTNLTETLKIGFHIKQYKVKKGCLYGIYKQHISINLLDVINTINYLNHLFANNIKNGEHPEFKLFAINKTPKEIPLIYENGYYTLQLTTDIPLFYESILVNIIFTDALALNTQQRIANTIAPLHNA